MVGRPVSFHAMRGLSAHSNGFHSCRALHLLQMLLGAIDCPGGFRYKPPFPRPIPPAVRPAGKPGDVVAGEPLAGPPLGFPAAPADLLVDDQGAPLRIDKAYSWEAPLAAHGVMQMVITNAARGDPYPIDTLFIFMANVAWNSSMNTGGVLDMLTEKDPESDDYKFPRVILADAYFSETVPYADLVLPDTDYLERHDCISLLDRPISNADGPADAIRQPVVETKGDVRPFQDVLLELGVRLGLPGLVDEDGRPRYPGGYPDYMANHERQPGVGLLAGWRGAGGEAQGRGAANPEQLERYRENQCFWSDELPASARFFKYANRDYLDYAARMGFIGEAAPIVLQLYSETLQKFRLAAQGHGPVRPPAREAERIETYFDPLPMWYPNFEEAALSGQEYPLHAITQRPMAMYHSWDSQNAWQRQIISANQLYLHRERGAALGVADGDWVWLISHHGRVKVQARLMDGVNRDTVWTWNAIGKRAGAWNLDPEAPEAKRGFLLNHLISELLPEGDGGYRYANADPVTGQAAWYDLQVRIEKAAEDEAGETWPQFAALQPPAHLARRPEILRYGARFRRGRGDPA
jgi:anaerobic selenocysteine-containing dehydrogenase